MKINLWSRCLLLISLCLTSVSSAGRAQTTQTNLSVLPVVRLSTHSLIAAEDGGQTGAFLVAITNGASGPLTVYYAAEGMAISGVDYVALPGFIEIPAGTNRALIHIHAIDDAKAEATEGIWLFLRTNAAYQIGNNNGAMNSVLISDNDNFRPTVRWVQPTDQSVFPGPTNLLLQAEASDADDWLRRVEFYQGGTLIGSVNGQDSNTLYSLVWSNASAGSYLLTAKAIDDFENFATSTPVSITITGPTNTAKPTVNVFVTDEAAAEGGNPATNTGTFRISRSGTTSSPLTVYFQLGSSANNGVDYASVSTAATIPAGSSNALVVIRPLDDSIGEFTESVSLRLSTNVAYHVGTNWLKYVLIYDNDPPPTNAPMVALMTPTNTAIFSGPTNLLLRAAAMDTDGIIQSIGFYANTNFLGWRYSSLNVSSFAAELVWSNAPPGTHVLKAVAIDNHQDMTTSAPVSITITSQTNIAKPTVIVLVKDSSAGEGDGSGQFMITRMGASVSQALTVMFHLSGTAGNGVDYTNLPTTVTLPAGLSNAFVRVSPINDLLVEDTETVILTLNSHAAYNIGSLNSGTIAIHDNDSLPTNHPPVVNLLKPTNGAIFINPTNILLRAWATDTNGTVSEISFHAGTVLVGSQKNIGSNATLEASMTLTNIPPGMYALTAVAVDNAGAKATSAPVNITVRPPPNSAETPTVYLGGNGAVVSEASTNPATIWVYRTTTTNHALNVYYTVTGTASNGVDYVKLPGVITVSIPPGANGARLDILPMDDLLMEPAESVTITLQSNSTYRIGSPAAATVYLLDNDNPPPTVNLIAPTNGATFTAPANLLLQAAAWDDYGAVRRVEFWKGASLLGSVTNRNSLGFYSFTWSNAPTGSHELRARAIDNLENWATSAPVHITIVSSTNPTPAMVNVYSLDPAAAEGGNTNVGVFKIARTGHTNAPLTVFFELGGTADHQTDYLGIPHAATIPAGSRYGYVTVRPVDDHLVEGPETVILNLRTNAAYQLGTLRTAVVTIADNDFIRTNQPPVVRITTPTNQTTVYGPLHIPIIATAFDDDGLVTKVEFFSGDHLLGGDFTAPYSLIWSNVYPGNYTLSAKAMDNAGAIRGSEPVRITVLNPVETSFVHRQLPLWYVPGTKMIVRLRAEPKTNTTSYFVAERPPENWTVGEISHGGVYHPAAGQVSFTFSDRAARTLTYELTPPSGAHGEKRFTGRATANNVTTPILGASVIIPSPAHPADLHPTNFVITSDEAQAYATAWQHCERWPIAPNPIPMSYATRASYLQAHGGGYAIRTNFPMIFPPLHWVSTNLPKMLAGAAGADFAPVPWTTNRFGTATSALPTNYLIGSRFTVTITVTPGADTAAYAVEDRPPLGWTVTDVSDHGVFCRTTGKIRWGIFMDGLSRRLSYTVTPLSQNAPAVVEFSGAASFDGVNVPITGERRTRRATIITEPTRPGLVKTLPDGNRLFTFPGQPGGRYTLETTTNLIEWEPIETLLNNDGALQYIDLQTNAPLRFYRTVPQP